MELRSDFVVGVRVRIRVVVRPSHNNVFSPVQHLSALGYLNMKKNNSMFVSCVTLNSHNLCKVSNSLALSGSPGPSRRVPGVPPVPGEAAGLRGLQREDPGPLHAPGAGPLLARGLPQVRLLRLPAGPAGLHPLHPGQPHPLPQGLPQVSRQSERPVRKKLRLPMNHSLLFEFSDRRSVPFKICLLIACCASKKIQLEEF